MVNGVDIAAADEEELRQVRMRFGVLFQAGALLGSMTVGGNVALPLHEYTDLTAAEIDLVVKMKLGMVSLPDTIIICRQKFPAA